MAKDKTKIGAVKAAKPKKPSKRSAKLMPDAAIQPGEADTRKKKKGREAGRKNKKKGGKLLGLLIIVVVVLIIVAAAVFAAIYNPYGVRDKLFDAVYTLDPREATQKMVLEEKRLQLTDDEAKLDEREVGIAAREGELDDREQGIAAEEERLEQLREQLAMRAVELDQQALEQTPRYLQPMSEEELADIQRLAKIYSTMSADVAAEIMASLYDVQDMVAILYQMKDSTIASILAVMDIALAVEITEILLHE